MKKILVILMMTALLIGCQTVDEANTNDNNVMVEDTMAENTSFDENAVVEQFFIDFKNDDYASMEKNYVYTDDIKEIMTESSLIVIFEKQNLGKVLEQQAYKIEESNGIRFYSSPTIFENGNFDITLGINDEKKIASFRINPFTGEASTSNGNVDLEEIALAFYDDFKDSDFEAMATDYQFADNIKDMMTAENLTDLFEQQNLGAVLEQQPHSSGVNQGMEYYNIPTIFENGAFDIIISFDNMGRINAFMMNNFTGEIELETSDELIEETLVANVNDMSLDGILTRPVGVDNAPCVIFVHGSGATDKDETIFLNKPFRDLAHGLAKLGVASYRYDKSLFAYPDKFRTNIHMTLQDETVMDAVKIYDIIKAQEGISDVYILGHSLGGYAIPLIAEKTDASGYVIMAGSAESYHHFIVDQYEIIFGEDGVITDTEQTQIDQVKAEIDKINRLEDFTENDVILGAYKTYWEYMVNYKPLELGKDIEAPVLVLQGERDYQVTMEQFDMWKTIEADNWTYISYPTLNHLMMHGEGPVGPSEYNNVNYVSEEVIKDIANWIENDR